MKGLNKMIKCKNDCPKQLYQGCCSECPHADECLEPCDKDPQSCADAVFEGTDIEVFQDKAAAVIQKITLLLMEKAKIDEAEKDMREQLQAAMDVYDIKSFVNDNIKITYIEESTRNTIDSRKLKDQMPEIYEKFTKSSAVKAFVKIELRGDKKK